MIRNSDNISISMIRNSDIDANSRESKNVALVSDSTGTAAAIAGRETEGSRDIGASRPLHRRESRQRIAPTSLERILIRGG
jgi:hypothetical protein